MAVREREADRAGDHEPLTDLRVSATARAEVGPQEGGLVGVEGAERGRGRERRDAGAIVLIHASGTFRFAVPDQPRPRSG